MANIQSQTVFQVLRNFFSPLVPDGIFSFICVIADTSYVTIPNGNWLREMVLHEPILSPQKYRRDIFDCDDYAMFLKTRISLYAANNNNFTRPISVCFILTDAHAFNFALIDDSSHPLFLLNTQSENIDYITPQNPQECERFLNLSPQNHLKFLYI